MSDHIFPYSFLKYLYTFPNLDDICNPRVLYRILAKCGLQHEMDQRCSFDKLVRILAEALSQFIFKKVLGTTVPIERSCKLG